MNPQTPSHKYLHYSAGKWDNMGQVIVETPLVDSQWAGVFFNIS
jgi:hypothetical protein